MSQLATTQEARRSSGALWKLAAIVCLALAVSEFLLAMHFQRLRVAAESERNIADKFHASFYNSEVWKRTQWPGIPSEQTL